MINKKGRPAALKNFHPQSQTLLLPYQWPYAACCRCTKPERPLLPVYPLLYHAFVIRFRFSFPSNSVSRCRYIGNLV
jgi:hypothetical protein